MPVDSFSFSYEVETDDGWGLTIDGVARYEWEPYRPATWTGPAEGGFEGVWVDKITSVAYAGRGRTCKLTLTDEVREMASDMVPIDFLEEQVNHAADEKSRYTRDDYLLDQHGM